MFQFTVHKWILNQAKYNNYGICIWGKNHENQGPNNIHLALLAGIISSEVVQRLPPEYKDPAIFFSMFE